VDALEAANYANRSAHINVVEGDDDVDRAIDLMREANHMAIALLDEREADLKVGLYDRTCRSASTTKEVGRISLCLRVSVARGCERRSNVSTRQRG
jgi:hypothetical protein